MKFIYIIWSCLFIALLSACKNDFAYQIEGEISNLENSTIYAIFEKEDEKWVDTIQCKTDGAFKIQHQSTDVQSVTLFFENKTCWTTVYPELYKTTKIEGDIHYPSLFEIKGNPINDELSKLRKKHHKTLKEITDIEDQLQTNMQTAKKNDLNSRLTSLGFQLREELVLYIQENTEKEASAVLINNYFCNPDDTRKTEELLAALDSNLSQNYLVKRLNQFVQRAKRTELGEEAPDFTVSDIYGEPLSLDSFPQKYLLLTFTAPWCEMCQPENIFLNEVVRSYSKDTIDMLLVSLCDDMDEIGLLLENDTIEWHLVTDSAGQAGAMLDLYNVNALPRSFLIDKERRIVLKTEAGLEVKHTLDKLFNK